VKVPIGLLPASEGARHAFLREYFCDKDAIATRSDDSWELHLGWPADPERHVDPALERALRWWGDGLTRDTMWQARRRDGKVMTALYDTWSLYSWSEWLQRESSCPQRLVILHVDDHRDLGSPRLLATGQGFTDAITGAHFDLRRPESVGASIASGAVGMGSFMTPFLHEFPSVEVRHLCQPPKATATQTHLIRLTTDTDQVIAPGRLRPSITLEPANGLSGPGNYLITPDLSAWSGGLVGARALLHIDMDYFNNRYDGDSDWADRHGKLDPPLEQVLSRVREVLASLTHSDVFVEDAVIAFSPGFFPAELWEPSHELLCRGLREFL
jgi:hypothetical protein